MYGILMRSKISCWKLIDKRASGVNEKKKKILYHI